MRFNKRDNRWEAYVAYRDEDGKRRYKTRYCSCESAAIEAVALLRKEVYGDNYARANAKGGYTCPSCGNERPSKNRRIVRGLKGEPIAICRQCHSLGPQRVGQNLRKEVPH